VRTWGGPCVLCFDGAEVIIDDEGDQGAYRGFQSAITSDSHPYMIPSIREFAPLYKGVLPTKSPSAPREIASLDGHGTATGTYCDGCSCHATQCVGVGRVTSARASVPFTEIADSPVLSLPTAVDGSCVDARICVTPAICLWRGVEGDLGYPMWFGACWHCQCPSTSVP
jgi:hypothetical protein